MTFNDAEVIEIGAADELIQDLPDMLNTEGTDPAKVKMSLAVYVADAE